MFKLIGLMTLQSLFLVVSQVFLKIGLKSVNLTEFSLSLILKTLMIYQLWIAMTLMGLAGGIWFYVLKKYEFSMAYPMVSISYVFAVLVSLFIFHETIPVTRYIGVFIILIGVIIVSIK